jgi:hypothetical protein
MTKRTKRWRGGLSPSRGPGRGLPAQTQVYKCDIELSRPLRPSRYTSPSRLI